MSEINTFNKHMVTANLTTRKVLIMSPPRHDSMTAEEAIMFAAWIVVCAEMLGTTYSFEDYHTAVENT